MINEIGTRITYALGIRGMTQTELAKRCNVSSNYISTVCRGVRNPSKKLIARICNELDINYKWMITGEGEPEKGSSYISDTELLNAEILTADPKSMKRLFALTIAGMPEEDLKVIKTVMDRFIEEQKKAGDE